MHSHPLPFPCPQRPALVPDRVRYSEAAQAVDHRGTPERSNLDIVQAELPGRACGELRDRPRVAEREGRFQIDEIGDGQQRHIELRLVEVDAKGRLGPDHLAPSLPGIQPVQDRFGVGAERRSQGGVELRTGPLAGQRYRRSRPTDAVGHLGELADLRQPGCDRDVLPLELPGPALPVPLLVSGTDRVLHPLREAELLGQPAGQGGVLGDHAVEVPMPGHGELDTDPEAMQRGISAAYHPEHGQHPARATQLTIVFA